MARAMFGVRLSEAGAQAVTQLAEEFGTSHSNVIRVMLGETVRNQSTMNAVKNRLEAMKER